MSLDQHLEPPNDPECCEAEDCLEKDEDGRAECKCDSHGCDTCGLEHGCRCDADYEAYRDSRLEDGR